MGVVRILPVENAIQERTEGYLTRGDYCKLIWN
jgi:hypothetical protein